MTSWHLHTGFLNLVNGNPTDRWIYSLLLEISVECQVPGGGASLGPRRGYPRPFVATCHPLGHQPEMSVEQTLLKLYRNHRSTQTQEKLFWAPRMVMMVRMINVILPLHPLGNATSFHLVTTFSLLWNFPLTNILFQTHFVDLVLMDIHWGLLAVWNLHPCWETWWRTR